MKLKLKSLAVALAMLGAGAAQAGEIYTDNVGSGLAQGTGDGDLWFAIYDPISATSLALDLDITVNKFRLDNASLIDDFSLTNSLLADFIAGAKNAAGQFDTSALRWNLGGISNGNFTITPDTMGILTTHGEAGDEWNTASEGPFTGSNLTIAMSNSAGIFASSNSDPNPNPAVVAANSPAGWLGGGWAGTYGGSLAVQNYHEGLVGGEFMSYIHTTNDQSTFIDDGTIAVKFSDAQWMVNGQTGTVSYVSVAPIPVPAAVWLMGSGLLGLIGIARRRA
jgi:hypothetical protein